MTKLLGFTRPSLAFLSISAALGLLAGGCSDGMGSGDAGACVPKTCADLGATCGKTLDGCNNVIECGTCTDGQTCGAAGPNVCGVGTCTPDTCGAANQTCGLRADGCGTVWNCGDTCPPGSTGGASGTGGTDGGTDGGSTGGTTAGTGGAVTGTGGGSSDAVSPLGSGVFQGSGQATAASAADNVNRYAESTIKRDSDWYYFIVNGWGPGFQNSSVSWNGTSFIVSMSGTPGGGGQPVGYPAAFCGNYADKAGLTDCGLPKAFSELTTLKTGWRWDANGNTGQYNAAWDIWLGDGTNLQSYLMVWLRDPPGQQPAGSKKTGGVSVGGQTWDVWAGSVNGKPIVNFVRPEGSDLSEYEFDVLDFHSKAAELSGTLGVSLAGDHVNSVAVGFEVWNSVTNVKTIDFYVDPRPR
jgi:hypothetical protein